MATNNKDNRKKKRSNVKPTFIISTLSQPVAKKISKAQQIQLDIIAHTNF
jgi:hypothetical protein